MLFKRCGCTEGMKIPLTSGENCEINDIVGQYVDKSKIKELNNGILVVTKEQCKDLQSQKNKLNNPKFEYPHLSICSSLSLALESFNAKDISNDKQCTSACEEWGGKWTDSTNGFSTCEKSRAPTPTPT